MFIKLRLILKEFWADQKTKTAYVIEDIKKANNQTSVILRLRSRANALPIKLSELIFDDKVLAQFDGVTARSLTFLYLEDSINPSLSLEGQKLDEKTQLFLLRIKSNVTGEIDNMDAAEFIKNRNNLSQLNKFDVEQANYLAGYNDGYSACKNEVDLILKKRNDDIRENEK